MKENIIHIIKVITGQDYRELKAEWEQQNITIDELTLEKNKKEKKIEELKKEKFELQEKYDKDKQRYIKKIDDLRLDITNMNLDLDVAKVKIKNLVNDLKDQKEKYEKDLEIKENQRKQLACRIGGYVTENNKLKAQVEFLKTHRRSPSLEEIKDYTLRRKSVCKKK